MPKERKGIFENMNTWHKRLNEALEARNKNAADLARFLNIKPPSVSDWISGKTKNMKGIYVQPVCEFLIINANWLFEGKLPSGLEKSVDQNIKGADTEYRRIPVISKIPAGGPKQIIDDYETGHGTETVTTDLAVGRYAFGLIIDGDSMEPDYKSGDKVIIDPDVRPRPGDCVAAKCNGDEATFKKYRPRGMGDNGDEVFELVPLNEDYPTIRSDRVPITIMGTMVEHRKYRRVR